MIHYDPLQAETVVSKKSTTSILHSLYVVMPWQQDSAILARGIILAFQHKRWLVDRLIGVCTCAVPRKTDHFIVSQYLNDTLENVFQGSEVGI